MNPLKKVAATFLLFAAIGTLFSTQIVQLFRSFLPASVTIVALSPVDAFVAIATVVFAFALVFTLPIMLFEAVKFVKPALYEKEKKLLSKMLPISIALFAVGAVFGIYIMAFFGLHFFAALGEAYGIQNLWSLQGLTESLALIAIAFGLTFQLPIALCFFVRNSLVTRQQLASSRPAVLIGLLVLAAILTPPDAVSQLLMAAPLYLLFEGTLLYLHFVKVNQKEVVAA